ncbi:MAG: glutamine amidotransferase-related protein [Candidatus Woesearchaeota archaeon]
MILIITTHSDALSYHEFVAPYTHHFKTHHITHYTTPVDLSNITGIIITGNALQDNAHLQHNAHWIWNAHIPIIAICAGAQLYVRDHHIPIIPKTRIGMHTIHHKNTTFEAYMLHNNTLELHQHILMTVNNEPVAWQIDNITLIMFHPEVRNMQLIDDFLAQTPKSI